MMTFIVNCEVEKIIYNYPHDRYYYDKYEVGKYSSLEDAVTAANAGKDDWKIENNKTKLCKTIKRDDGYYYTYTITMQLIFDDEMLKVLR